MACVREYNRIFQRSAAIFSCFLLLSSILLFHCGFLDARGQTDYYFISEPSKIPYIDFIKAPVIEPGDSGKLKFSITNRYLEPNLESNNMTDVELIFGIYEHETLESTKAVTDNFAHPPLLSDIISIESSKGVVPSDITGIITIEPSTNIKLYRVFFPTIPINTTYVLELLVETELKTKEGSYAIKTELNFNHASILNRSFTMKSMGHYTRSEWELARNTATENAIGDINLSALQIDGIIPETSFSVSTPFPLYPRYIVLGLTIMFGISAIIFYYMEEHGKFKGLKEWLDRKK